MDLYTNRISKNDFIKHGIVEHVEDGMDIFIASAFFTESSVIDDLLSKGCHVRIVVRLGFPTSPNALDKLLNHKNVEARFYTSNSFHPKLYIFGDKTILVGSANLTSSAILSNQEVMVGIDSEDVRFAELQELFGDYWDEAEVLTKDAIKKYRSIYNKFSQVNKLIKGIDDAVTETMGDVNFSNINRGKKKTSKKSIFLDSYRKSYQEAVTAFRRIEEIYNNFDRKVDAELIPQRLEIDSFFSFVRDFYATQDTWKHQPIGWDDHQKARARSLIDEWLTTTWEHFEDRIVPTNYPLIKRVLGSKESIKTASMEEIVDALCVLHSFHDRFRFYKGGLGTLKETFIANNEEHHVKNTLTYLLFGSGDAVGRMADCIYDSEYKLNEFGKSNVQELIGWINKEELPVINGRTTKVLRYFGNDIRQISES
ncbi:phospholipase D-like domain-containing protein [Photobacterium lutimaris]|uniref:Alcohol dehydrogenase n=1 Tax=Photobacterium lutimaris TaxID=388278 RepID=A0A2T3J4J0_9GAMM|nr:phospholipase D-like domain-containing protein [Photobacterium lutimaris]PSU36201.1 alcohol dehydrogenase [Photobacterium lutimaris]TDR74928.1 HKD family nuclease [Photobacterium lutimaris]